jgi:hypothetical protein
MSRSLLLQLCEQIVDYMDEGSPAKDAIEPSNFSTDELIYELASHYVAANRGKVKSAL